MLTVKQVRDVAIGSTVGKTKRGTIIVRRGFFYTNGCTAEIFRDGVVRRLAANGIEVNVVDFGEIWKPFRGGATTAQGSHWYVELSEKV